MRSMYRNIILWGMIMYHGAAVSMNMVTGMATAAGAFGAFWQYNFSDTNYDSWHVLQNAKWCKKQYEAFIKNPYLGIEWNIFPEDRLFYSCLLDNESTRQVLWILMSYKASSAEIDECQKWISEHRNTGSYIYDEVGKKYSCTLTNGQLEILQRHLLNKDDVNAFLACTEIGLPMLVKKGLAKGYADLYKGACYSDWPWLWYYTKNAMAAGAGALGTDVLFSMLRNSAMPALKP